MHCAELTGRKETRKDGRVWICVCVCVVCLCVCVWVRKREREREAEETEINCGADLYSRILQPVQRHRCSPQSPCSWNPQPWNPATTPGCMDGRRSNCVCVPVCPTYVMHQRCVFICLCVCCCSMCGRICAVFFFFFSGLKGALHWFLRVCVRVRLWMLLYTCQ